MMAPPLPPVTFTDEPEHVGQLRDTIRRFVAAHAPREARIQWDRDHRWPRDVYAELNKLGLTALTVPEDRMIAPTFCPSLGPERTRSGALPHRPLANTSMP